MKQFKTVFRFEFVELIKTRSFKITTAIFCVVTIVALSLPTLFMGNMGDTSNIGNQINEKINIAIYDENNAVKDNASIKVFFPKAIIQNVDSLKELKKVIKSGKADAGFDVKDALTFKYYVLNSDLMDMNSTIFAQALSLNYRHSELVNLGISSKEAIKVETAQATFESVTLGSDGASNIIYTFALIVCIYMVIIMYGSIIATSVASEKGNRTMELLATSANPTSLIFGKVLSGCLAAFLQIGLLLVCAKGTYMLTSSGWNGALDMMFDIPSEVLIAFFAFGIFGFIFYSFLFGAVGALVSKSEDVSSSITPIMIIFIAVYLIVFIGVKNSSSALFTIASFVPFSSPMAMFARMAMVNVPLIEVIISLIILIISTAIVGVGASKIYRRATLMYGNQIKLRHAFKWLSKKGN